MTEHEIAEPNARDSSKKMSLGEYLTDIRRVKRQSLREIEEATGKSVSNAYLSQLEKGHIKKPSPNILYSLANVYSIPYDTLMEKAGYITESFDQPRGNSTGTRRLSAIAKEPLTEEEEEALLDYLAFIRSKKKKS